MKRYFFISVCLLLSLFKMNGQQLTDNKFQFAPQFEFVITSIFYNNEVSYQVNLVSGSCKEFSCEINFRAEDELTSEETYKGMFFLKCFLVR